MLAPITDHRPPSSAAGPAHLNWSNRFARLGERIYTPLAADPLPDPHGVAASDDCAALLGLPPDWWQRKDWRALQVFSGHAGWPGVQTLAGVYSGHQLGVWAGQLGDGHAHWLGEIDTSQGPFELQLKGSGLTPSSRIGDGRAVLRSTIREFVCSETTHALRIPTTRALGMTAAALPVRRESVETAAAVTRVAPSFVRIGHFEHFCHHDQHDELKRLLDFVVDHHFPEYHEAPQPVAALLETVARCAASLLAQWQAMGICHGVMNTDNPAILGLTIDCGPLGFLDAFDPAHVCNHSDQQDRYACARQPQIAFWHLHALAQAILPLLGETEIALAAFEPYKSGFADELLARLRAKLGLREARDGDRALVDDLLKPMAADRADYTITWRRLAAFDSRDGAPNPASRDLFLDREGLVDWAARYAARLRAEASVDVERAAAMGAVNPKFALRNHLAEGAIRRAREGDFDEVRRLLKVLSRPYDEQPEHEADAGFPPDWAQHLEVSCSS